MNNKQYIDISIDINEGMLNFPGDKVLKINHWKKIKKDNYNLSKIEMSVHTGTHVDAPSHFIENGKNIDEINPERFVGEVQIIEINNKEKITLNEIEKKEIKSDKIIFKTNNSKLYKERKFNKKFVYLSLKAAKYLVENNVKMIGIDYLTIEELDTKDYAVHKLLLGNEIIILEGVILSNIKPGIYNLLAVPLKLKNCEASPVRALLYK